MIWLHLSACELWVGGPLSDGDCDATSDAYYDGDGDGWGDERLPQRPCAPGEAFAAEAGDCDDLDPDVHPDAAEVCDNGRDDDCDGPNGAEDGLVDCDDDDCDGDPACAISPTPEVCDNGADDDLDGDTDCDDLDCASSPDCGTTAPGGGIVVTPPSYVFPATVYSYGFPEFTSFDVANTGTAYRTVTGMGMDNGVQSTNIWTLETEPDTPPYGLAAGQAKQFRLGCNPTPQFGCGTDDVEVVLATDDPLTPEIRVPVTCSVCS